MRIVGWFLENRVRAILTAGTLCGVLIPIIVLTYGMFDQYLPNARYATGLATASEIDHYVSQATAQQAVERGLTATALSQVASGEEPEAELVRQVRERRERANEYFEAVVDHAEDLRHRGWGGPVVEDAYRRLMEARDSVDEARGLVDRAISDGRDDLITADTWTETVTALVDHGAEFATVVFYAGDDFRTEILNNRRATQALWAMAEYAGRQRAMVGSAIGAGAAFSDPEMERFQTFQGIIHLNAEVLRQYFQQLELDPDRRIDPGVLEAYEAVEADFLGDYQRVIGRVSRETMLGRYRIFTPSEWVERSTAAIDTVLELSDRLSANASGIAQGINQWNRFILAVSLALIVGAVVMAVAAVWVVMWLMRRISGLRGQIVTARQNNDLTVRIQDPSADEIGSVASAFNGMMETFAEALHAVVDSSGQLAEATRQLRAGAERSTEGMRGQQAEVDQVATAMNEMSATIQEVARNAQSAADAASGAANEAGAGKREVAAAVDGINSVAEQVRRAAEVIRKLDEETHEVSMVLDVIREVAEQTNLLALNAAIEAARAGEQGRGFAVVADEVRTLASRTQESTEQIREIVERLQGGAGDAVRVMDDGLGLVEKNVEQAGRAGAALDKITDAVATINDMNGQIAGAVEEQRATAEEINRNMNSIAGQAQTAVDESRQTAGASESLSELADRLQQMVSRFKLGDGGAAGRG